MNYRNELQRLCRDIRSMATNRSMSKDHLYELDQRAQRLLEEIAQGYNGWTNYETWNVKLWMDNDEANQEHFAAMAQGAWDGAEADETFTREERATLSLSDALKDAFETESQDWLEESNRSASVWADLLGASLSEVNWHEIAEHLMENVSKPTVEA